MKKIKYPSNFLSARFSIILGLFGFGKMWSLSNLFFTNTYKIGEIILLITCLLWLVFIGLYGIKLIKKSNHFIDEIKDPINNNYIGLIGVSSMLIATVIKTYIYSLAELLFITGLCIQLGYGVYIKQKKWLTSHQHNYITPSLYIPSVAGNFVTALVAGVFDYKNVGYLFLGIGFFSWISLESIIMNRLYKVRLDDKYLNTLGIMVAPSSIAAMSCFALNEVDFNLMIRFLIGYGIFHLLVFLRFFFILILKPFHLGYWAFSFGFTTLTNVIMLYYKSNDILLFKVIAFVMFLITNIILSYLIINSIAYLKTKYIMN